MEHEKEGAHSPFGNIFIPSFTPPPISKDWERSFYTPQLPGNKQFGGENARTLRSLHFFFTDMDSSKDI
jgi:hypothetical protein